MTTRDSMLGSEINSFLLLSARTAMWSTPVIFNESENHRDSQNHAQLESRWILTNLIGVTLHEFMRFTYDLNWILQLCKSMECQNKQTIMMLQFWHHKTFFNYVTYIETLVCRQHYSMNNCLIFGVCTNTYRFYKACFQKLTIWAQSKELQLMSMWHYDVVMSHRDGCLQSWKKTSQIPVTSD